ncbi:hypothetical protein BROUX41_006171 [Berkeleyomyces rouxiae]|uniref:uncharacterized protein n=1 Tax=Berkeleyomyces rouxiae TaxID=2035830 RepID=UPI003B7991B7
MSSTTPAQEGLRVRTSSLDPAPRSAPLYRPMPYPTQPKQQQQQQIQPPQKSAPLPEASQPFPPTAPLLPPAGSPSPGFPKTPMQSQQIKKQKPRKKISSAALAKTSRWIMSDEILHRFRKVEAQEIITEDQLEKVKQTREAAMKERMVGDARGSASISSLQSEPAENAPSETDAVVLIGPSEMSPKQTSHFNSPSPAPSSSHVSKRNQAGSPSPLTSSATPVPAPILARHDSTVSRKTPRYDDSKSLPPTPRSPSPARSKSLATIPEVTLTAPADSDEPSPTSNSPFTTINPISPISTLSSFVSDGSATPRNGSVSSATSSASQYEPSEDEDFIYFHAAPTSGTTPSFRHGRIRISKAESGIRMSGENNLDWTAFQMAILGAGDWFSERASNDATASPICEVGDMDELTDWFYGMNLPDCPEPAMTASATKPAPMAADAASDQDLPPPPYSASEHDATGEKHARFYSAHAKDPGEYTDYHTDTSAPPSLSSTPRSSDDIPRTSACIFPPPPPPRRQTAPYIPVSHTPPPRGRQNNLSVDSVMHGRRPAGRGVRSNSHTGSATPPQHPLGMMANNDSMMSLPQSPMPPIAKTQADESDFIPMGYNLGHDLGDFLRWEAQHVYASTPQ